MSYLFPRNIGGFTSIENFLVNELQIQTQSIGGFSIYVDDPTKPLFTVDGSTGTITTRGTLNVLGTASFTTIEISETKQSLFELASANSVSDLVDIGIYGEYNSGSGSLFSGVFRNSADTARRWFFVKDILATPPITNMPAFTNLNFTGIVADNVSTNNGTSSAVAHSFYSDADTGMYLVSSNSLGFSAGSVNACTFTNTGSAIDIICNSTATLYFSLAGTTNDIASSAGGVTTGSLTLQSSGSADKWQHYISTNPVAAYAGEVFSFGLSSHYFASNSNGSFQISQTTQTLSALTTAPDYRHSSKLNLFGINSNYLTSAVPILVTLNGTASAPVYSFSTSSTTGIFQSSTNTLSFSANGINVADLKSDGVYPNQQILVPAGSLSSPYYSFVSHGTTGLYTNTVLGIENISLTLGGNIGGAFILSSASTPQLQMPQGSSTYPSFAFNSTGAGIYSPQIGGATQGLVSIASNLQDVWIFKNRSSNAAIGGGSHQCLNSLDVLPNGNAIVSRIDSRSSKFINARAKTGSFEGFNLLDTAVLLFYRFNNSSALGTDSSESSSPITAVTTGHVPGYQLTVPDGTITKKYVLDLTGNSASPGMYLDLTSAVSTFAPVNNFSLSFWFKCSAVPVGNGTIINFKNTTTLKNITLAVLNGSDSIQVTIDSNSITTLQFNTQGVVIKDGKWHHVVLQLGTDGNKFYLDNVQLIYAVTLNYTSGGNGAPTADYATNTLANLTFDKITIGGQSDGVSFSSYFTGYLYSIYMTAALISLTDIAALYNEGSITTYSIDATNLNVVTQTAGQVAVNDGTALAPGFSFQSETNTGFYKIGSGNIGLALLGSNVLDINSTRLQNSGLFRSANGSAATPAYSFTAAINYGMYYASSAVFLSAASTNILKGTSAGTIIPYGTNFIFQRTGGNETTNIIYADVSDNLFLQNTASAFIVATFASGNFGFQIRKTSSTAAFSVTNDAGSSTLLSIDTTNSQLKVFDGTAGNPGYAFQAEATTGLYRIGAGNVGLSLSGVNYIDVNSTRSQFINSVYLNDGSVSVPSLAFTSATNMGLYKSAAATMSVGIASSESVRFSASALIVPYSRSIIFERQDLGIVTNSILVDSTNTLNIQNLSASVGIDLVLANATSAAGVRIRKATSSATETTAALSLTNFDGTATYYRLDNVNLQTAGYSGTVANPGYAFHGDSASGLYLISSGNLGISLAGTKYIDVSSTRSQFTNLVYLAAGSVSAPSLAFNAATNNGFYYVANQIKVANVGINTWTYSPSGTAHICNNPLNISANGSTTAVLIGSSKMAATQTQTLLNNNSVLEYNFINMDVTIDNSINSYIGATNGSVSRVTSSVTLNPIGSGGLLNYYAMGLAVGSNGIYTNTSMAEMTNSTYLNITMNIMFPTGSSITGACWIIYGNFAVPTQNHIRIFVASGVLNVVCMSGSTTIIAATYSTLLVDKWYIIEFITGVANNSIFINGVSVTLAYSTGNSSTPFSFNAQITDKSAIRTYIGGGINSLLAPNCYINYFSLIQTNSTDTVLAPYKEQIHELYTNKLVVQGYPYNNSSAGLNEGYLAISSKVGQLQWDSSIKINSDNIVLSKYLYLQNTAVNTGAVKRTIVTDSGASIDLATANYTNSHYLKLTANTVSVTLPTGSAQSGREYIFIYKGTPGSFTINKSVGSSDTIMGTSSFIYTGPTNAIFKIIYDGISEWIVL